MDNIDMIRNFEKKCLEEYGYYIHAVIEDGKEGYKGGCYCHTHGLESKYNHLNLEISVPEIETELSKFILNKLVSEYIAKGITLQEGIFYHNVITLPIRVKRMSSLFDDKEPIFRVLLPDSKGIFPDEIGYDNCFTRQLSLTV